MDAPLGRETDRALAHWLALSAAPGLGPRTIARLVAHLGSPEAVLGASHQQLRDLGLKPPAIGALCTPDGAWIDSVMAWCEQPGAYCLTPTDPRYPAQLAAIPDPPILLFVRGDPDLLVEPQLAIVGSRNPTPQGRATSRQIARDLAARGLVITSGLATGIDGEAHAGALQSGRTIAVMGTGTDRVYPASHRPLALRIMENGALVSELPPGVKPLAANFPRRNRIISGLCLGTLVVEATIKSGSLITARQALEQGREVMAVPGSVHSPLSRGCHALIRDGARLVEGADDVLCELAPALRGILDADDRRAAPGLAEGAAGQGAAADSPDPEYQSLLDAMGYDPVSPDELVRRTGLAVEQLSSMLLVLELQGHVSSAAGGRYCRMGE